jgi:hypothetical protein
LSTRNTPDETSAARVPEVAGTTAPKFTPGPWALIASDPKRDGADCWTLLSQPHPGLRGFTRELAILAGPQGDDNALANARLIAAAPDLYEALKDFMDKAQLLNCVVEYRGSERWEIASDNFVASMRKAEAALAKASPQDMGQGDET